MAAKDSHINPTFIIAILSGLSIMLNSQAIAKNIKAAIDAPLFIYFLLLDFDHEPEPEPDHEPEPDLDLEPEPERDLDREPDQAHAHDLDLVLDRDLGGLFPTINITAAIYLCSLTMIESLSLTLSLSMILSLSLSLSMRLSLTMSLTMTVTVVLSAYSQLLSLQRSFTSAPFTNHLSKRKLGHMLIMLCPTRHRRLYLHQLPSIPPALPAQSFSYPHTTFYNSHPCSFTSAQWAAHQ